MDAGCHGTKGTGLLMGTFFYESQRDKEIKAGTPRTQARVPGRLCAQQTTGKTLMEGMTRSAVTWER